MVFYCFVPGQSFLEVVENLRQEWCTKHYGFKFTSELNMPLYTNADVNV